MAGNIKIRYGREQKEVVEKAEAASARVYQLIFTMGGPQQAVTRFLAERGFTVTHPGDPSAGAFCGIAKVWHPLPGELPKEIIVDAAE